MIFKELTKASRGTVSFECPAIEEKVCSDFRMDSVTASSVEASRRKERAASSPHHEDWIISSCILSWSTSPSNDG